jgi:hypothetical protein
MMSRALMSGFSGWVASTGKTIMAQFSTYFSASASAGKRLVCYAIVAVIPGIVLFLLVMGLGLFGHAKTVDLNPVSKR